MQDELGLDWYDYGARFYDAKLALFHTIVPKAEEYNIQSPYVYDANTPIRFIDVNGEIPGLGDPVNNAIAYQRAALKIGSFIIKVINKTTNGVVLT